MFEAVHIHTRVAPEGRLRVDMPSGLPPNSEVDVTVSMRPHREFDREEWEAHVDRIAGSIPDLEAPERWPDRDVEPL